MMGCHRFSCRRLLISFLLVLPVSTCLSRAENTMVNIPSGTPIPVQVTAHYPMRTGEKIEAHLLYPIYADNHVAIPAGTLVRGSILELDPDQHRRIRAKFDGDFTPFHIPVVRFDQLVFPDGSTQTISSSTAKDGAPVLRLAAPSNQNKMGSMISRQIAVAKQQAKDRIAVYTAPGKGDRLLQFVYHQLPYHPERIESGTAWTVELTQPLPIKKDAFPLPGNSSPQESAKSHPGQTPEAAAKIGIKPSPAIATASTPASEGSGKKEWLLDAYLKQNLSSSTARPGEEIQAVVAEPVFNADHTIAVPEGAMLIGTVTQAKPARSFGRRGNLRFDFRQVKLPEGSSQHVEGILAAAASNAKANLQMNSEGVVQPKAQDRIVMPLVLSLLANHAFDRDGSQAGNGAIASNGFGIVGRVIGIAAGSRNIAAGIGFYGTALSVYDRWFTHGRDVVFARDTRIEILTTPARANVLSPSSK